MEKMAVTGGAGFIGSNLAEHLLNKGFSVTVIDNLSTGREQNLAGWSEGAGNRFQFLRMDINETKQLRQAFEGVSFVFHLAAIPSVARSIDDPATTQFSNINGTLSVLTAARDAGVKRVDCRFVFVDLWGRAEPAQNGKPHRTLSFPICA